MNLPKIRASFAAIAAAIAYLVTPSASAAILATNNFETACDGFVADIDGEDASALTAYNEDQPSTTAPYPFSGTGSDGFGSKYLKVDTGDATIFREFGAQTSSAYLDAYMQFEPTSGEISYTNVAKIVVYLDAATSNLCVISGTAENDRTPVTNYLTSVGQVTPGTWGRLTINAIKTPSDSVFSFNVLLNGNTLSAGGTDTFYSLTDSNAVSRVGFKGTGALDDLVARTSDPFGTAAKIGDETYGSLAQAGEEAVGGQTILLETASNEDITLYAAGVIFDTNGKAYTGHVSAASGLGYTEVDGVYTASANTAATWTDAADDHDWSNADNWSSHGVPTESTDVTIPATAAEDGWLIYIGGNAQAKSVAVFGDTTFQRDADISNNGNIVVQQGITTGVTPATLTLNSANIFAGNATVTISCPIVCRNGNSAKTSGFRSNVNGSFAITSTITGTGTLEFLKPTTFSQDLNVLKDGFIAKFGAQPTFSNETVLKGNGTVVWTVEPIAAIQTMLCNSENWTGVCEIYNMALEHINAAKYGNVNSTVRYNKVSGYSAFSTGNTYAVGNVKCIDIGAEGLTYDNTFSTGSFGYSYSCALTGTGTITFGTSYTGSGTYTFTGDASAFAGKISFGTLEDGKKAAIVFNSSDAASPTVGKGQIGVAEGTSLGLTGFAGTAVGGGRIICTAEPSNTGTFDPTAWTGEFVIKAGGKLRLPAYGQKVVIGSNVSGYLANSAGNGVSDASTGELRLDANLTMNNGWSRGNSGTEWVTNLQKINKLSGTGDLNLTWGTTVDQSSGVYYQIATLDGSYSGTITAGGYTRLKINTVDVESVPTDGSRVVAITLTGGNSKIYNGEADEATSTGGLINVTVGGESDPNGAKLFRGADGLYVAVAKTGDTYYPTVLAAVAAASQTGDDITVLVGPAVNLSEYGYYYDEATGKWKFGAASVIHDNEGAVTTNVYATLAAAISASVTGDTVKLLKDNSETGIDTTGKNFVFAENGQSFTGTLTGNGTITLAAAPSSTTWSSARFVAESWTGTVVLDYNPSGTPFNPNLYGTPLSYVELATGRTVSGYLNNSITTKLRVNGSVTLNNGSSSIQRGFYTVSGSGTFIFQSHDGGVGETCNYAIDNLVDWNGTMTIGSSKASITNIVSGSGSVVFNSEPTPAPAVSSGYTGSVALNFNYNNKIIAKYGGENSTIVLGTMTGYLADGDGTGTGTIASRVVVDGKVCINNGWTLSAANYNTWNNSKITHVPNLQIDSDATFTLVHADGTTGWGDQKCVYWFDTLDGTSSGTLRVGGGFLVRIDNVRLDAAPVAGLVVPLRITTDTWVGQEKTGFLFTGTSAVSATNPIPVVGSSAKLVYATVNDTPGLYLAVAQYGSNYYATFQDALNARKSAGVPGDIIALDASAPLPTGYSITDGKLVRTLKPMVILF